MLRHLKSSILTIAAALSLFTSFAYGQNGQNQKKFEIAPLFGYMTSSDLEDSAGNDLSMSSVPHFGAALSWQESPNGQGQVLVNYVSHEFDNPNAGNSEDLDILYAHFNGVALFRQSNYVSTFSFGLGGAYMDSAHDSALYPSATLAFGTRYEMQSGFAVFTELRGYATLTDEDDEFFCEDQTCYAEFSNPVYFDASVSVGVAFSF